LTSDCLTVRLIEMPESSSGGEVVIEILDQYGDPVDAVQAELSVQMLGMAIESQSVDAEPLETGQYRAKVALGMAGEWQIGVTVTRKGSESIGDRLELTVEKRTGLRRQVCLDPGQRNQIRESNLDIKVEPQLGRGEYHRCAHWSASSGALPNPIE
jgi:hypothetical protein